MRVTYRALAGELEGRLRGVKTAHVIRRVRNPGLGRVLWESTRPMDRGLRAVMRTGG